MKHERSTFWGAGARSRFQRVLPAAALLWLTLANDALAAGVVGDGTPGSCTQAALDTALAGGATVSVNCGPEPTTITTTTTKTITQDTRILGDQRITLSAGHAIPVFRVEGATLNVVDLTVARGRGDRGGGIFNDGTLAMTRCTFSDNYANEGAAIYNNAGRTVTLNNTKFSSNRADVSAGAILNAAGTVTVTGGTFSGNKSTLAGAIANFGGTLTVIQSTFSENSVSTAGGAIFSTSNLSGRAGVTVVNSTFSQNSANQGGAVVNVDGDLTVTNATFAGNTGAPGAIDSSGPTAAATVTNSIVASSAGSNCAGAIADGGHNLQWPGTGCGETIPSLNPLLDPAGLRDNGGRTETIALLAGSPAAGAGDPAVCANPPVSGIDQRGYPRPNGGPTNCTIGAYEYNSPSPPSKVVGTGTLESCTDAALSAALLGDGIVTFDCGPEPVTIMLESAKVIDDVVTVDGGGLVTLSGGNTRRLFRVYANAVFTLRNMTIANGNTGAEGGAAIFNRAGTVVVIDSTLRDHVATDHGGALTVLHGALTLIRSTISGSSAPSAGAIYNLSGTVTVVNSTLSGNHAEHAGGILNDGGGTVTLTNASLAGNTATTGRAIANSAGTVRVTNSIIAEQTCSGPVVDGGHNLQWPGTDCGETIPSLDPLLDPAGLQDNGGPTQTIALLPGRPAIDAGDPDVCADPPVNNRDQRGYARPGTGYDNCSIGAYEYNSPGPPLTCVGDCGGEGQVTVDEILTMVNIALGNAETSECEAGDDNDDGQITVDEILKAVNSALNGCPIPDVSGPRQRDQAAIVSSTCDPAIRARVQQSIDAGNWNCTYVIAQSGPNLTITETCPDGTDTFPGTVDTAGRITVVRTEQETQDSCTFTQTSRSEVNGSASTSTGVGRLQFDFSTGCAFTDCEIVVESRFSQQ